MIYAIAKLEFCPDPLSDTTPTYVDVTRYCQGAEWFGGVTKDTDSPQAGGATFQLKNLQRRFEPEYTAGAYYPNIVPGRRFRLTITADGVNYSQGTYYAREWKVEYPDPSLGYSVVTVSCADGFWRLAQDVVGVLSPQSAETYADVVKTDNPFAYYPMNELDGKLMKAEVGVDGQYRGNVDHVPNTNPVLGSGESTATFNGQNIFTSYARAPLADEGIFFDVNRFTVEAVAIDAASSTRDLAAGPWNTANAAPVFNLTARGIGADINIGASTVLASATVGSDPSAGRHHFAGTWDGHVLTFYVDGVVMATDSSVSGLVDTGTAGEFLYAGGNGHTRTSYTGSISHVAFYLDCLPPSRIKAHADAAVTLGYAVSPAGTRIAALATDPLWSTAGIPAGSVRVAATMQHGQSVMDEITAAHSTESPGSLFFFNDAGNPDYNTLLETWTPAATFGDTASEVNYQAIDLAYDDDLFNTANVSGDSILGATASNSQSLADYGNRGIDQTSLPLAFQSDAALLAQTYVDRFSTPAFRCESLTLNGKDQPARTQILTREIGDVIRVKRRGEGGVPIDIVTRILGKSKSIDVHGNLVCTWSLARGFNASVSGWRVGVTGFSEVGQTTVAG